MVPIKALLRMVANHSSVLCVAWSSNARATGRDTWSSTQAWKAISVRCVPSAVLAKTISSPTWRLDFIFLLSDLIPLHVVFDHYLNVSISLLHDLILLRLTKKCRNKAKDVLKLSSWHHAVLEIRRGLTLKPVPIFFPGTSAPGPGWDVSVWTLSLYLLPSLQPEASHALPPALPTHRRQGERGDHHRHGGRGLPDGWRQFRRHESDGGVPAALGRSAADVPSSRGVLQSHPHQGGATRARPVRALPLQHLQGPCQQQRQLPGPTRSRGRSRRQIQPQRSDHSLLIQPWHHYQNGHWPAYEAFRLA